MSKHLEFDASCTFCLLALPLEKGFGEVVETVEESDCYQCKLLRSQYAQELMRQMLGMGRAPVAKA